MTEPGDSGSVDETSRTGGKHKHAEILPRLVEKNGHRGVWPGCRLDWTSPYVAVQLYVELPFWLMMPEGTFDVKYEDAATKVTAVHGCEEIQRTTTHFRNSSSTVFIARPGEQVPEYVQRIIESSRSGCSAHIHRTTLIIEASVLHSALRCSRGDGPEKQDAMKYFRALAVGHLPVANTLIAAYRRAGYDPFVQEITEATAPIWFMRVQDQFFCIPIYYYAGWENRPEWPNEAGQQEPANFATVEEVTESLTRQETPGETTLLDAWAYFYSGRFSDSIRGFVTALEVLLEARYSEAMKACGVPADKIEAELRSTATRFNARINNYLQLTKRTIPGPLISWIPYINGVRLRQELTDTRELRHKIVHEGLRMSPFAHGPMLRAAETMTWLFDWLEDREISSRIRFRHYNLKNVLKGMMSGLYTLPTPDGIRVIEREYRDRSDDYGENMADDQLWGQYRRALFGSEKDFAKFAKMSLACILAGSADIMRVFVGELSVSIPDHEELNLPAPVRSERFRYRTDGLLAAVFLIELDGELTATHLMGVLARLLQLRVEFHGKRVHGICLVNHQQNMAPDIREATHTLPGEIEALLTTCDISLVFATDLSRYLRCARDRGWPVEPIRVAMLANGHVTCQPPDTSFVGQVLKTFPKPSVLGVAVHSSTPLNAGDRLLVQSGAGFELMTVHSIEQNKKQLLSVSSGETGLKVDGNVKRISEGAIVYRVTSSAVAGAASPPPVPAPAPPPNPPL